MIGALQSAQKTSALRKLSQRDGLKIFWALQKCAHGLSGHAGPWSWRAAKLEALGKVHALFNKVKE